MPVAVSDLADFAGSFLVFLGRTLFAIAQAFRYIGDPHVSWEFVAVVLLLTFRNNRGVCLVVITISIIVWCELGHADSAISLDWFASVLRQLGGASEGELVRSGLW